MTAERDISLGITALMHHHQPPAAQPIRRPHHRFGHGAEGLDRGQHPRQRIEQPRVIATGDDDHVGTVLIQGRQHDALHCVQVADMTGTGGQRNVQVEPQPRAAPAIRDVAGIGGIVALLMQADRHHIGAVVEHRFSPVAVMHIPVDHRDPPLMPRCAGGSDGNADIVQQAEPVGPIGQAMMPRRARQGIGILMPPLPDREQRRLGQPR